MKKITIFLTIIFFSLLSSKQFLYAASPTPSAATSDTTEELKKRIEKAVEEKREQIKGALQGIAADEKGFVGEVQRVTDEAITITSKDTTTIIPVSSTLTLVRKNTPIKLDDVAVGNWAIVIGKEASNGEFAAEKINISTDTLKPKSQTVVIGTITSITAKEVAVNSRLNAEKYTFVITKNSDIENNDGTTIAVRLFQKDLQVLLVGIETDTGLELKTMRALAPLKQ